MKPRGKKDLKKQSKASLKRHNIIRDVIERRSTVKKTAVSEQMVRDLADHAPTGMVTVDLNGRFTYVNRVMADFVGSPIQDLMGRPFKDYIHPEDRSRIARIFLKAVLLRRLPKEVELRAAGPEGSVRHLLMRPWSMRAGGKTVGIGAVLMDVTERRQMEDELRASEERYRSLVERMHDALLVFGEDRRIEFANRQVEAFVGYKPEEIIGEKFDKLLTREGLKGIADRYERRRRGESVPSSYELQAVAKDGTVKDFEVSAALFTIEGKPKTIAAFKDITERKRMEEEVRKHTEHLEELVEEKTRDLRESVAQYRSLFESSRDAITINSTDGRYVNTNDALLDLLGYSKEETLKMNAEQVYADPVVRDEFRRIVAKQGFAKDFEVNLRRKDGTLRQCLLTSTPWRGEKGQVLGYQGIIRDITERKRMEEMREQFVSAVTHELRTPLVPIKANVDFVLSGKLGALPEKIESSLQLVKRNTDRLAMLTDDLLDIRRLQSGRFQLNVAPMNLLLIIHRVIKEFQSSVKTRGQSITLEAEGELSTIRGDPDRLTQVLTNLLANASKFTPENGEITIRATEQDDVIKVQVSDTGIGIRKEDLKGVFEPFAAIRKPTYIKGTGLGLSITKGLVEAHGGKIWAESAGEGKGATFTFTVPKGKKEVE